MHSTPPCVQPCISRAQRTRAYLLVAPSVSQCNPRMHVFYHRQGPGQGAARAPAPPCRACRAAPCARCQQGQTRPCHRRCLRRTHTQKQCSDWGCRQNLQRAGVTTRYSAGPARWRLVQLARGPLVPSCMACNQPWTGPGGRLGERLGVTCGVQRLRGSPGWVQAAAPGHQQEEGWGVALAWCPLLQWRKNNKETNEGVASSVLSASKGALLMGGSIKNCKLNFNTLLAAHAGG